MWQLIWKLDCPTKIKNFMWRALVNGVAVKENLKKREVCEDGTCSFWDWQETVEHAILLSDWCAHVWFKMLGWIDTEGEDNYFRRIV